MNPLLVNPQARAAPKKGTLYLYDAIGEDGMGGGISSKMVVDALKELKDSGSAELEVRISSPGGSVFDGLAMYRAISEWKGPKTAIVDGLAASAASFVMLSCDKVKAGAEAMVMIHEAWGGLFTAGTADEIVAAAEALAAPLRKCNDSIVAIYAQRTGMDEKKCRALMSAETWMTGAEAKAQGFVSEVLQDEREPVGATVSESAAAIIAQFKNAPEPVRALGSAEVVRRMEMRLLHHRVAQARGGKGVPGCPGSVVAEDPQVLHRRQGVKIMRNPLEVLREKLAQITADAKAVEAAAQAAGRVEFTDDETTKLNELHASFEATEAQIAIHERNARIEAASSVPLPSKTQPVPTAAAVPAMSAARLQPVSATYQNHGFTRGFSEFLNSVKLSAYGKSDARLLNAVTTYGGEGGPGGDGGGFAVPPQFATSITELVVGEGSLVSKFTPIMTSSNQVVLPTDETTPYGTSGIYAEWLGEATAMSARAPSLKQVTINLNKVGALVHLSDELVEDAPAIQSHVTRKVAQAIAAKVNEAIMNGDGNAKPLGLMKAPALVTVTKTGSGTPIASGDLPAMTARMVPESFSNSFWLAHNTVFPKIWTLTVGQTPVYAQDFRQSPYGNVLGRPIFATEFAQDYNTAGDIMLVSPDGYAVAIKSGGIQTAASIHFAFDQGLQSFRATMRVGGTPLAQAAITRKNGSSTLSHIVCLGVRS